MGFARVLMNLRMSSGRCEAAGTGGDQRCFGVISTPLSGQALSPLPLGKPPPAGIKVSCRRMAVTAQVCSDEVSLTQAMDKGVASFHS